MVRVRYGHGPTNFSFKLNGLYSKLSKPGFFISKNFTGAFEMPGVESIPRFSVGYLGRKLPGSDREDDKVTSVSMPDVKNISMYGFLIGYADSVVNVSFPKLEFVEGDVLIMGSWNLSKVSFPALETVNGGIALEGGFDEIDLPAPKNVDYLRIRGSGKLDCPALGKKLAPQLNLTQEEDDLILKLMGDGYTGFTCAAPVVLEAKNWFNSSDPDGPSSDRNGDKNDAGVVRIEYGLGAVLLAMGIVFGLS
ncbi:hypothetical protein V8F20_010960 [Naviculisporaceae sp. PSN 640]